MPGCPGGWLPGGEGSKAPVCPPPWGTVSGASSPPAPAGTRAECPPGRGSGFSPGPRAWLPVLPGPQRVARGPRAHGTATRPARPREPGRPRPPALPQPGAVTFQPPDSGRAGRGAGGGAGARLGPGGGTRKRPPRPEPPCNRRRPEQSRARAPATRTPWGTRTRTRAAPWSCGSPKVGQGWPRRGRWCGAPGRAAGAAPGRGHALAALIRLLRPQPT